MAASPELVRFAEEATEAAHNRAAWWPSWVFHFGNYIYAVTAAARVFKVPFAEAHRVASDHLVATFRGMAFAPGMPNPGGAADEGRTPNQRDPVEARRPLLVPAV